MNRTEKTDKMKVPGKLDMEDGEIKEEATSASEVEVPPSVAQALQKTDPKEKEVKAETTTSDSVPKESSSESVPVQALSPALFPPDSFEGAAKTPAVTGIRPLSPEELDQAKSIVLDLLGWGVEPEYLIDCGVSSHAIYKIFTDLHLRLPRNLNISQTNLTNL